MTTNNLKYEQSLYEKGYLYICGVDEAGRGPLAGPVVAAAVILKKGYRNLDINDSKTLSAKKREQLFDQIQKDALAISISIVDNDMIDDMNILEAARDAMEDAVSKLKISPDYILTDYMDIKYQPHLSIKHGDRLSMSIAAASIVAKVTRDRIMIEYDKAYPNYGFKDHKGYGTKKHLEALHQYGASPIHRKTFKPVLAVLKK